MGIVKDKLEMAQEWRAKGRSAKEAANLVGWSRATLLSAPVESECSCGAGRRRV